jgi:multicomponent Na+:H+ antiporter subunit D
MGLETHPGLFLLAGALLLPLLGKRARPYVCLLAPALALLTVWTLPGGAELRTDFFGYELVLYQVDALSRVFGLVFSAIALIGGLYAWQVRDAGQGVAALVYAAGALGVTFAGDFFTLLIAWELMTIPSAALVWSRRTGEALAAGRRYLLVHLTGGALLMAGIAVHLAAGGGLALSAFPTAGAPGAWLILAAVAVNAAIPPLGAWLPDAYPRATVTGAVFMSALTTKSAVYVLARLFPGWEILVWAGVLMALYGVLYAVLANDIRQILAYHIISQVGYMVAGVGIGTEMALNGTAAHAFSHILYKALLFMGAGAVLHTTGRSKLTELGGLGGAMPLTVGLYMIGAFSISGFPLFNGFISKSMIIAAAAEDGRYAVETLLMLASVGTFLHTGLKLPYWTWFGPVRTSPPKMPVPRNMIAAMGVLAVLCTLFGVWPQLLYGWLPAPVDYQPYTLSHLIETTQLLIFTFLGFWLLRSKVRGESLIALDTDWLYRVPARQAGAILVTGLESVFSASQRVVDGSTAALARAATNPIEFLLERHLPDAAYDPDRDRVLMGTGIAFLLLLVVVFALGAFWR